MPLLAGLLGSLFMALVSFFAKYLTKRVAIVLAAIGAVTVVTGAFIAAINAIVAGFVYAVPASIQIGASWIMPYNFDECLGAIVSGHLLRWGYDWNVKIIQWKLL